MSDLKPCPFCREQAEVLIEGKYSLVQCTGCNSKTSGWTNGKPRPNTARETWNKRPIEDALQERIKVLVATIQEDVAAIDSVVACIKLQRERINMLEAVVAAIDGHDTERLKSKVEMLKQSDGEGWAVGELLERALRAV